MRNRTPSKKCAPAVFPSGIDRNERIDRRAGIPTNPLANHTPTCPLPPRHHKRPSNRDSGAKPPASPFSTIPNPQVRRFQPINPIPSQKSPQAVLTASPPARNPAPKSTRASVMMATGRSIPAQDSKILPPSLLCRIVPRWPGPSLRLQDVLAEGK